MRAVGGGQTRERRPVQGAALQNPLADGGVDTSVVPDRDAENRAKGWELANLTGALACATPVGSPPDGLPAVNIVTRAPAKAKLRQKAFIYRVSWRFDGWEPDFWRIRYAGYTGAKVIVDRLAARGAEWKVERCGTPTADIDWQRVNVRPTAVRNGR